MSPLITNGHSLINPGFLSGHPWPPFGHPANYIIFLLPFASVCEGRINVVRFLIIIVKFAKSSTEPQNTGHMKKKITAAAGILFLLISVLAAQEQPGIPAGIATAFRTGSAAGLAVYLNNTVELVLPDKEDFYSKSVAETILKDFFAHYKSREFTIRHQGSKGETQYAIANLVTDKGHFRVYFLLKKVNGNPLIHQIRIESENE